jgi:hypothetical protein
VLLIAFTDLPIGPTDHAFLWNERTVMNGPNLPAMDLPASRHTSPNYRIRVYSYEYTATLRDELGHFDPSGTGLPGIKARAGTSGPPFTASADARSAAWIEMPAAHKAAEAGVFRTGWSDDQEALAVGVRLVAAPAKRKLSRAPTAKSRFYCFITGPPPLVPPEPPPEPVLGTVVQ